MDVRKGTEMGYWEGREGRLRLMLENWFKNW